MVDVLLPRTDAGVLAQLVVVTALTIGSIYWLRHRPEWRVFATGVGVLTLGLMALRTVH